MPPKQIALKKKILATPSERFPGYNQEIVNSPQGVKVRLTKPPLRQLIAKE